MQQKFVCLLAGVNMPDHDVMFNNLTSLIRERVTRHLAVLKSKDCTNIKAIMRKTIQQLMDNVDVVSLRNKPI